MSDTFLYWHFRTFIAWILAVFAGAYFVLTNPDFSTIGNLFALAQSFSVLLLVGTGLALVMLIGEFDLSITALFPLTGLIAVKLNEAIGVVPGVLVAVLIGLVFALLNGALTALLRIPSLAVTIGTMVLGIGLGFFISDGKLVYTKNYQAGLTLTNPIFGLLSIQSIIELLAVAAASVLVGRTWAGRYLYAVGSDVNRARASGMPVTGIVMLAFVVSGLFTAIGGSLQGVALATGQAGSNDSFLLQAATAAVLGGIALTGGKGNLLGVTGASLLLAILGNGLSLAGADSAAVQLTNGVLLLAVVLMYEPLTKLVANRSLRRPRQAHAGNNTQLERNRHVAS